MSSPPNQELVDHLFREEYGKMVAVLTRIFGFDQLELVEDVVQDAFLSALRAWREQRPDNPQGWLMRVARNRAIDLLRRGQWEIEEDSRLNPSTIAIGMAELFHEKEVSDSQLRLIFACCHPALDECDQLAFTLQLASGFGVKEIGTALLTNTETIKKRLQRARRKIRDNKVRLTIPIGRELKTRLESVLKVLYLTFNEGYQSSTSDEVIRRDLCAEAMRLTKLVCEHPVTNCSDSNALLALMCYHAARFDGRLTEHNEIILLANQDRTKWNQELIRIASSFLSKSISDDAPSIYVLEAAIAAQHCNARSYASTSWRNLLVLYDSLYRLKPTSVVWLNRIVILAEMGRGESALAAMGQIDEKDLVGYQHLYHCVKAQVYERLGDSIERRRSLELALTFVRNDHERALIRHKLDVTRN